MPGVGIDNATGAANDGWQNVLQSIRTILTTPIGTRVMRREFGSELMSLIDAPLEDQVLLALYVSVANAIARWEPRFRIATVGVDSIAASGRIALRINGTYFPRGHMGDFSTSETASGQIVIREAT